MQVLSLNSVINWADTCYVLFLSHAQFCRDFWWTCSQGQLISSASHLQIFGNLVTTWLHVMSKSHPTLHQDKGSPWSWFNHSALWGTAKSENKFDYVKHFVVLWHLCCWGLWFFHVTITYGRTLWWQDASCRLRGFCSVVSAKAKEKTQHNRLERFEYKLGGD